MSDIPTDTPEPIFVTHLDHASVIITSVEKAREFYGLKLGLKEIAPPKTFDFVALWYQLGQSTLHLLWKPERDSVSPRHFCLHVPAIESARKRCRAMGIAIQETVKIPGADRFFIYDPDQNRIEILQWQEVYDPEQSGRFSA